MEAHALKISKNCAEVSSKSTMARRKPVGRSGLIVGGDWASTAAASSSGSEDFSLERVGSSVQVIDSVDMVEMRAEGTNV